MGYRIKRIDPFWRATAPVIGLAAAAAAVAVIGAFTGRGPVLIGGAILCGVFVFLATKPALSGVFAVFGLMAGIVTFLLTPSPGLSPLLRVIAACGFGLFYMVLMDGVVLVVSAIYNMFARVGLGGLSLGLEE
ncbi:MAG: hypothetical protein COV48_06390 [Elusimicrobia bacterium CG11_big_fil_rev_8_21_14_0_20_64_6]|nr:MAG: hypothetical protein COV48_06390 [Elusimicrobia bacterium CG11_big_fil_rev_8_21_14_0_20_64_6]